MGSRNFTSERGLVRLLEDLQSLLEDSKSGDTVFLIGSKEIPVRAHSFILRLRCKSFRPDHIRFPDVNPELFRTFLAYIYTGKLSVEETTVFDLFCLAGGFGMEDLERTCEELLCSHLDSSSAFTLLNDGLSRIKIGSNTGLSALLERCITFIGENPFESLQATRFLSLPMETLIAIISSDQLCLDEEEVWNAVLRWSQFQANVDTHVSRWTEEERVKVAKFLGPVMSHVRLLLIDSRIFAEEIEPTGCVPMALSLERYRFAALPHQFKEADPRLTPRNAPRLFQSSSIIKNERINLGKKLNEWFGEPRQSWRCIFRASVHGFSADAFHSHCDGIGDTLVVACIKNTNWICGGFADVPWTRSKIPRYATSNKAFLFCYDGTNCNRNAPAQPLKFSVVKKHFALCHDSNSGPIFGAGADLCIASNCNENTESYSNLPHSYESDGGADPLEGAVLTPTYMFAISDYEVFVPNDMPVAN